MRSGGTHSWTKDFIAHYLQVNKIRQRTKPKEYAAVYCRQLRFTTAFHNIPCTPWHCFIFRAFIEGIIHLRAAKYLIKNYDFINEFSKDDLENVSRSTGSSIITKLQLKTFQDWIRTGIIKAPSQGGEHGIVTNYRALGKTIKARD